MKIFLDDVRNPKSSGWIVCRDSQSAIDIIRENWKDITEISLDHDLGDDDIVGNGYDVVKMIEEFVYTNDIKTIPNIHVHSSNSSAGIKMELAIKNIEKMIESRH